MTEIEQIEKALSTIGDDLPDARLLLSERLTVLRDPRRLYSFEVYCGRQGTLEGAFIANSTFMKRMVADAPDVWFYEPFGKHSEVCATITDEVIKDIGPADPKLTWGYNPVDEYLESISSLDQAVAWNRWAYGIEDIPKEDIDYWTKVNQK